MIIIIIIIIINSIYDTGEKSFPRAPIGQIGSK